jgi:hypothetical protein
MWKHTTREEEYMVALCGLLLPDCSNVFARSVGEE